MRIPYLLIAFMCTSLAACTHKGQQQKPNASTEEADVKAPGIFFKKMEGKLSSGESVFLYIIRDTSGYDGPSLHIVIDDTRADVPQEGIANFDSTGTFTIISQEEETDTPLLQGTFITANNLQAYYYYPPLSKAEAVQFTEVKTPLTITPLTLYKENLQVAPPDKREGFMCDSFKAYNNLNCLKFEGPGNLSLLNQLIYGPYQKALADTALPNMETSDSRVDILYYHNNFITCESFGYYYSCGAAHGNYGSTYTNYNLSTGDTLTLNNLIKPEKIKDLTTLCKKKFFAKYERTEEDEDDGMWGFYLTHNVAVLRNGLLFCYNPYELGPYSEGQLTVTVSYSEIKDWLVPGFSVHL